MMVPCVATALPIYEPREGDVCQEGPWVLFVSTRTSEGARGSPRGGWPHIPSLLRTSLGPSPAEAKLPVPVGLPS